MHTLEQLRSGQLAGVRRLDLSCGLTEFPPEIFTLADSLEVLNLTGNALTSLPDDLPRLHRLQVLFCSSNRFTDLPVSIGPCPQLHTVGFKANQIHRLDAAALPASSLRALILTDNHLTEVPAELGRCSRLLKLMLSGNRLSTLPAELSHCRSLELLRLAANRFTALPGWLLQMPRLAWLACGGNPFSDPAQAPAEADRGEVLIDWQALSLQGVLGEGTSGVIHRALYQPPGHTGDAQPVAVKLFKGKMTSDGLPHSEMAACLRAGGHPNLIGALGRLQGHPEGPLGLVMPLVDPAYRVLAGPPSLDSCTRDVHDAAAAPLSVAVVRRMALGVARAVAHLHARGILHGDLYAHNILWHGQGEVLLGDFGAAALMPLADPAACEGLQRTEVLAWACLLAELLARADQATSPPVLVSGLMALQQACSVDDPAQRPLFDDIAHRLEALAAE
ncbi:MAG: leucine-rich repeat-containing protein kinase family protein [Pseudomonadota bacterium]